MENAVGDLKLRVDQQNFPKTPSSLNNENESRKRKVGSGCDRPFPECFTPQPKKLASNTNPLGIELSTFEKGRFYSIAEPASFSQDDLILYAVALQRQLKASSAVHNSSPIANTPSITATPSAPEPSTRIGPITATDPESAEFAQAVSNLRRLVEPQVRLSMKWRKCKGKAAAMFSERFVVISEQVLVTLFQDIIGEGGIWKNRKFTTQEFEVGFVTLL